MTQKINTNPIFDQYKLFVQTTEKVSDRRLSSNKYFLSINSIILVVLTYLFPSKNLFSLFLLSLLGLILATYWLMTLKSYRGLNSAKFKVIHEIEKNLPVRLFTDEWSYMGKGKDPKKYLKLSVLEQIVPKIFMIIYSIGLLKVLINVAFNIVNSFL